MEINIGSLLSGEKSEIKVSYGLPLGRTGDGCEFEKDADVTVTVKSMGGYVEMTARVSAEYETFCARCLEKLTEKLETEFVFPVGTQLENEDEEEEYIPVLDGDTIAPDELIRDEILLSLPLRSLCSEDCKGLCPKCGCNRNKTECTCVLKEPDPRWAALKNFSEKK